MKRICLLAILVVLAACWIGPTEAQQASLGPSLTVYSDGALVEELRTLSVSQGEGVYLIEHLPEEIVPDSVIFRGAGLQLLEQEYLPAEPEEIVSGTQLGDYIGQEAEVTVMYDGSPMTYRGTLLSAGDGISLVLQESNGNVRFLSNYIQIVFIQRRESRKEPKEPRLAWKIHSDAVGEVKGILSYLTGGLSWSTYYAAILNETEDRMALSSWVTLTNSSGREYKDAKLTLIAGELHRVTPLPPVALQTGAQTGIFRLRDIILPFETRPTFEYHEYKLTRSATLKDQQTLQLSFLKADAVKISKHYVYEATASPDRVRVEVRFVNDEARGLGIALPAGIIRLYKETAGALQLVGEDILGQTPKNEKVTLVSGMAFDLKAERVQKDRQALRDKEGQELHVREMYEIQLRNQKAADVVIEVKEQIPADWKIISSEPDYEKLDVNTVLFKVPVKANDKATVKYTIEWRKTP